MNFHKIEKVTPLPEFCLDVHFLSGEQKKYHVKNLDLEPFQKLCQSAELFSKVKVDVGGYGISWNDEIDLSCDELYKNGKV
ncbi:MAG: DUF2442 domain-containing protein [Eubacteriales bacterium]